MPDTARRHRASSKSTQLADIAERTGYSLATVSKVLNGRSDVAAGTRRIIEEALRDRGYTKRISTTKNRKLIEAVFQNFDNIWSLEVLRGIVHEASAHEMSVVTTESGDRSHPDSRWVEGVLRRQPLGVVLIFSNLTESEKSRLQAFNIDYVTLDPAGDPSPDNLSVQADNWTGGIIATRHLLSLGHTRIGIITGPNSMLCSKARLDGYKAALDEHDIPFDPDLVREGDFSTAGGYLQGLSLLKNSAKRPTAIFAHAGSEDPRAAVRHRIRRRADGGVHGPGADHGPPAAAGHGRRGRAHDHRQIARSTDPEPLHLPDHADRPGQHAPTGDQRTALSGPTRSANLHDGSHQLSKTLILQ